MTTPALEVAVDMPGLNHGINPGMPPARRQFHRRVGRASVPCKPRRKPRAGSGLAHSLRHRQRPPGPGDSLPRLTPGTRANRRPCGMPGARRVPRRRPPPRGPPPCCQCRRTPAERTCAVARNTVRAMPNANCKWLSRPPIFPHPGFPHPGFPHPGFPHPGSRNPRPGYRAAFRRNGLHAVASPAGFLNVPRIRVATGRTGNTPAIRAPPPGGPRPPASRSTPHPPNAQGATH